MGTGRKFDSALICSRDVGGLDCANGFETADLWVMSCSSLPNYKKFSGIDGNVGKLKETVQDTEMGADWECV